MTTRKEGKLCYSRLLAFAEAAPACQRGHISNSHQSEKQYCNIGANKPSLPVLSKRKASHRLRLISKGISNQTAYFGTYKSMYYKTKLPGDIGPSIPNSLLEDNASDILQYYYWTNTHCFLDAMNSRRCLHLPWKVHLYPALPF